VSSQIGVLSATLEKVVLASERPQKACPRTSGESGPRPGRKPQGLFDQSTNSAQREVIFRSMTTNRERLITNATELLEKSTMLRSQLGTYESAIDAFIERLRADENAAAAAHGVNIPEFRQRVTDMMKEFDVTRHQLRVAFFAVGKDEGASGSELGRALGISRQLASRIAAEAEHQRYA